MTRKRKCRPVAPWSALNKYQKTHPDSKQNLPIPGTKMQATPIAGPVCEDTLKQAAAAPAEKGASSCLDSGAGCGLSMAMPYGFGRGAVDREAIGATCFASSTPRHRMRVKTHPVVFSVQQGTEP